MILRKPYAFLIKYFKIIHIIMFVFFSYLVFSLRKIYIFFVDYVKTGSFTYTEGMSSEYITPLMFIMVIIILSMAVAIYFLMRKKNKPVLFYILAIIHCIVLLASLIYFTVFFKSLDTTIYPPLRVVINRDIIMFVYYLNFIFVIFSFIRGFGFDIKKFSFDKDKKELHLEETDSEEYEFTVKVDKEDFITYLNRQKRELLYYLKENSTILIIISVIIVVSLSLYFYFDIFVINKVYKENQVIKNDDISYKVNKTYVTNIDKYGDSLNKNNNYVIVDFTIQNDGHSVYLDEQMFRLQIKDKYYYLSKTSCDLFNDLGICYQDQKINSGSIYNFIGVYKIDNDYDDPTLEILKSKKQSGYVYTKVKLSLQHFEKKAIKYNLNEDFIIDDVNYQVVSYKIYNKTTYKYEECNNNKCNTFEKFVKPRIGEVVLAVEIPNLSNLSEEFLKTNIGVKYNDKVYTASSIQIIDWNLNTLYLSVPASIKKSNSIELVILTRQNEYNIMLGAGNYE